MTYALLPAAPVLSSIDLPSMVLPAEAMLVLTLAVALALVAALGPAEEPPSEEVTTAAIFAVHGHV
jgi:hypothetical protein